MSFSYSCLGLAPGSDGPGAFFLRSDSKGRPTLNAGLRHKAYLEFPFGVRDKDLAQLGIKNQAEHDERVDPETELMLFLDKNRIEYDERRVLD